ncbi:eukaryotic translation initiation factor 2A [Senna tora]|uniref:Eukaryotic translation initiation factor 2A n=1 Tax=Senna tora TaxID=362788 RepID=A0A834SRX0_9FABA|nr:eukaryotic translation initiation factor 2A [Senna tora]
MGVFTLRKLNDPVTCGNCAMPLIQFSSDEAVAFRMATNEVQFFNTEDFSKGVIYRLKVPGVAAIELSRTPGSHVAVFIPESKVCILSFYPYNGGFTFSN